MSVSKAFKNYQRISEENRVTVGIIFQLKGKRCETLVHPPHFMLKHREGNEINAAMVKRKISEH